MNPIKDAIKSEQCLFDTDKVSDQIVFSEQFFNLLMEQKDLYSDIIILCIGTDRATGDSLGPLIGHKLNHVNYTGVHIYGTLDTPVHAKNLHDVIDSIYYNYDHPYIIAIDACLGKIEHIGYVGLGKGTIKPGAGVNKNLPEVGDVFITGIVNFSGVMDMIILQNTRLSLVMKMADFIVFAIKSALWKYHKEMSMAKEEIYEAN